MSFNDLDALNRKRDADFRDRVQARIGRVSLWLFFAAAAVLIGAAIARATPRDAGPRDAGPPMDDHPACDMVCAVRYCTDRCVGPHRDRLTGLVECRRECLRVVEGDGCWPCREGGE